VNDFRKIGAIECYTPNDNVAELTARTNDEGWDTVYAPPGWNVAIYMIKTPSSFSASVGGQQGEEYLCQESWCQDPRGD